ncbi:MAG TPA: hypothetical protein VF510_15255 [Ktedonobacterales bacterium]
MSSSMGQQTSASMGQPPTGMSNETYDLVSILYHALENGFTSDRYIQDAQQAGDNDLVQFFQQCQQQDRQRAQQAQQLLSRKLQPPMH